MGTPTLSDQHYLRNFVDDKQVEDMQFNIF